MDARAKSRQGVAEERPGMEPMPIKRFKCANCGIEVHVKPQTCHYCGMEITLEMEVR